MSSVALRCATCGTTQSHPGECEACFDGEVRYFCSNHSPGLWLDEPVCRRCSAKFGDAPRIESKPSSRSTPVLPATETRRAESRPPKSGGGVAPRHARPSRPPVSGEGLEDTPTTPSLVELLVAMAGRTRARYKAEEVRAHPPEEHVSKSLPIVGCLVRLVLLIIAVIALVLGGLFVLLSGWIS